MRTYDISAPTPQGPADFSQQAFLIAVDFHEAAIRSGLTELDPQGAPILPLCPMIVCYAFAAELYLKSLRLDRVRGHELDRLFRQLPSDTKETIALKYLARSGRSENTLEADLRLFAKAFENWRYVFEGAGQQVRTNLLIAFTQSLYETARELQPDWEITEHRDARLREDPAEPSMTVFNLGGGTFLHVVDGTGGLLNTPEA